MSLNRQYDQWHKNVLEQGPAHADEGSPWYRLVSEYLVGVEGMRVLEIACGRGGFANTLALRGAVMFGADFSGVALQIARSRMNGRGNIRLSFTQTDAQLLPYADECFDIVVSCETIEHLPSPVTALTEMARVSRPNGLLFLTTPNYFNAMGLYYVYASMLGKRGTPGSDQPLDHVFIFPGIRRMLRQAGWKILRTDGTVHQFPIRRGHSPVAVPWLESNRKLCRLLSPLALHYFIMARRHDSL